MKVLRIQRQIPGAVSSCVVLFFLLIFNGCRQDDPKPVNEEEVITTVEVILVPLGGGDAVTLKFFDPDGELGSIAPLITASGNLEPARSYTAQISLQNETVNPPGDITEEVLEEAEDHLFCYAVNGPIAVTYTDEDSEGHPVGLITLWQTFEAGSAQVTISLRHQAGTKTGECPGAGDTDVEVTFEVEVE